MTAEILLGARVALHLAIVIMLACYYRPSARYRFIPSLIAGILLASSASAAVQILITWPQQVTFAHQPQHLFMVLAVFIPVAWARGNVAKIYDALRLVATRAIGR